MTIAEFFIKLGITGSDTARKELKTVGDAASGISTSALAAYAAIAAMIGKLKELGDHSLSTGTNLQQFSANTGMSVETLQRYQYAAGQAGVSNEAFQSSITNLQSKLIDMRARGQEAFSGMSRLMSEVRVDDADFDKPFKMLLKFQELATHMRNEPGLFTKYMMEAGFDAATAAAAWRGVFNKSNFDQAKILSEKEINELGKSAVELGNIKRETDVSIAKLVNELGPVLIPQIKELTLALIEFVGALAKLAKETNFLNGISAVTTAIVDSIKQLVTIINIAKGMFGNKEAEEKGWSGLQKIREKNKKDFGFADKLDPIQDIKDIFNGKGKSINAIPNPAKDSFIGPPAPNQNTTIINIMEDKSQPRSILIDEIKRAVEYTYLNISSQTQAV